MSQEKLYLKEPVVFFAVKAQVMTILLLRGPKTKRELMEEVGITAKQFEEVRKALGDRIYFSAYHWRASCDKIG